jgi:hypothetical protein
MRYQARQFLADWEFEHIKGVARANREEHARLLAEKCRDDAAKAGINKWALEIVAGGDLIRKLIGALNEAEFRHTAAISGPTRGFRLDFLRTPRSSYPNSQTRFRA